MSDWHSEWILESLACLNRLKKQKRVSVRSFLSNVKLKLGVGVDPSLLASDLKDWSERDTHFYSAVRVIKTSCRELPGVTSNPNIQKRWSPKRNTDNFTTRCTRMSLIWTSFRVPCKLIRLFTPVWQQRGSIEASVYLSCSGCVGQQVSQEHSWPCFSVNASTSSGLYECKVTATNLYGCIWEFASRRGYTVRVCVCMRACVHLCV